MERVSLFVSDLCSLVYESDPHGHCVYLFGVLLDDTCILHSLLIDSTFPAYF